MNKAITPEEFEKYQTLRGLISEMKLRRSDLLDLCYNTKKQLMTYETQFDQLQEEIDTETDNFSLFIEELAVKYGLGMGMYNFSETEPHYITEAN